MCVRLAMVALQDLRLNEWNLGVIEGMSILVPAYIADKEMHVRSSIWKQHMARGKDEAAAQHADDWNVFSRDPRAAHACKQIV